MSGSLFVVTRVGQLRNAQTFIREHGSTGNRLVVVTTNENSAQPAAIRQNVDAALFDEVSELQLPPRPVTQRRHKNRGIYRLFEDLLTRMVHEEGATDIFLCNSNAFYSFFERINNDRQLGLSFNLLEEGLGTYASAGARHYHRNLTVNWSDLKHRGRHVRVTGLRFARSLAGLLVTIASWVLRVDAIKFVKDTYTRVLVDPRYRYGHIEHYDNAYVYFPERIYQNNIRIDRVKKLEFVMEHRTSPEIMAAVEDDAVVFVSQRYLPRNPYVYYSVVFDILTEMGLGRVYFKFHPREDIGATAQAWERALREHPRLVVLTAIEIDAIPVEELMMDRKVKTLIGLTSTALMYGKEFFSGVECVSIGARFLELADSDRYDTTKRALSEFSRDLEIFLDVSGVPQFLGPGREV
jgi:hypothetical protein